MTSVQPQRRGWDTILSIILLILFAGWVIVCAFAGALISLVGDSCGSSAECNYDQIGTAAMVGMVGPVVIGLIIAGVTISRLVRKRIAFWVPLLGFVLTVAVEVGAYITASNAVVALS
jgi:hypothetical protein